MRFSNTLDIEQGSDGLRLCCNSCKHPIAGTDRNWKHGAILIERPAHELEGPYRTGRDLLLRHFSCARCGALLDTEMALPGEPWIDDRLLDQQ